MDRPLKSAKARRSIAVFGLSLGGSNGPALEFDAIFTPPYNAARFGLRRTYSPYQADVIVMWGSATAKMAGPALELLGNLPADTRLVLLGAESLSAAPFADAYATFGPILPSDASPDTDGLPLPPGRHIAAYVTGSPPDPQVILDAIVGLF